MAKENLGDDQGYLDTIPRFSLHVRNFYQNRHFHVISVQEIDSCRRPWRTHIPLRERGNRGENIPWQPGDTRIPSPGFHLARNQNTCPSYHFSPSEICLLLQWARPAVGGLTDKKSKTSFMLLFVIFQPRAGKSRFTKNVDQQELRRKMFEC